MSKVSTGLVGLAVNPTARSALVTLYRETLQVLNTFPKTAAYRQHVERLTTHRLSVVESETSPEAIESKINNGQVEELVRQAEDELSLAKKMSDWKPWEELSVKPSTEQWKWP